MNDLFLFDPARLLWTEVTTLTRGPSPSPREGCFFAEYSGKLYLFGGWSETTLVFFNDLFVLDLTTLVWTDLTPLAVGSIPPPVSGHCFITMGKLLYVFGGQILSGTDVGAYNSNVLLPLLLHKLVRRNDSSVV